MKIKPSNIEYGELYQEYMKVIKELEKYRNIEEELKIDLITLFNEKYEENCLLCVEEDKSIYFCGDAYYGHYSKEGFINLIKELISAYIELIKRGKKSNGKV